MLNLKRTQQEQKLLWEEIRNQHPDYFATQAAERLTVSEAQALASQLDATLISYYRHDQGWVAFVIQADQPLSVVELPITNTQLLKWQRLFYDNLSGCANSNLRRLKNLYQALITPLAAHLPPPNLLTRLVFAPFGLLHLLPLSAIRHQVAGKYHYLGDEYVVTVTPNLASLNRVNQRRQDERSQLCALGYAGVKGSKHYLPNVEPEVSAIAKHFPPERQTLF